MPEQKFVEASGKSFNTIPPSDYSFFEMINANVQQEPADSYDVELAGQLAAIGIVKGKEFAPDERMKKIMTDALAVANAKGVVRWVLSGLESRGGQLVMHDLARVGAQDVGLTRSTRQLGSDAAGCCPGCCPRGYKLSVNQVSHCPN